jgi:hypothetical protein
MSLHVTGHAISRYRERVDPGADFDRAHAALTSAAVVRAADFGAPFVKLGTGQRIVIVEHRVVTVLPADTHRGKLDPSRDRSHGRAR